MDKRRIRAVIEFDLPLAEVEATDEQIEAWVEFELYGRSDIGMGNPFVSFDLEAELIEWEDAK